MSENTNKPNDTAKIKENYRAELISTVDNLKNEMKSLEKVNALLRNKISELEEKNKEYLEKIEILQAEKNPHPNIETNLVKLQKKIAKLETENQNYLEELNFLKGEHVPETPGGKVQQLLSKRHAALEASEYKEKWNEDEITKISTEKVQSLISKRHTAMEGKETMNITGVKSITKPEILTHTDELTKELPKITIESPTLRRACPNCGNNNKNFIYEVLDKTTIIMQYPRMYGKKFTCGECGAEWR